MPPAVLCIVTLRAEGCKDARVEGRRPRAYNWRHANPRRVAVSGSGRRLPVQVEAPRAASRRWGAVVVGVAPSGSTAAPIASIAG